MAAAQNLNLSNHICHSTTNYPGQLDVPRSSLAADLSVAEPHGRQLRGRRPADLTGVGRAAYLPTLLHEWFGPQPTVGTSQSEAGTPCMTS